MQKKKKNGACVFWAPSIFLSIFKFFGGKIMKIEQLLLIVSKNKFKENWRMRILSTPYFSKFFGGKITNFEQRFA